MKKLIIAVLCLAGIYSGSRGAEAGPDLGQQLIEAVRSENLEGVKRLLEAEGVDVDVSERGRMTPLQMAASMGNLPIVQALLDAGAEVNREVGGFMPLHLATNQISRNLDSPVQLQVAEELINKGAKINARNFLGMTPLMIAVSDNNEAMVRMLLDKGADPTLTDNDGKTALSFSRSPNPKITAMIEDALGQGLANLLRGPRTTSDDLIPLINQGANVNIFDRYYGEGTPLMMAARLGKLGPVKTLLDAGADPGIVDSKGETALDYAKRSVVGNDQKAVMDAIQDAIEERKKEAKQAILLQEGERKETSKASSTELGMQLFDAIRKKDQDKVKELVRQGADVSVIESGSTPLRMAVAYGLLESVKDLIGAGGNANEAGLRGTLLQASIHQSNTISPKREVVQAIIDAGADVNAQGGGMNSSALIDAVSSNFPEAVHALLKAQADKDLKNVQGQTALDVAIGKNYEHLANMLLD